MVDATASGPSGGRVPEARRRRARAAPGIAPVILLTLVLIPLPPPHGGGSSGGASPAGSYALYPPLPSPSSVPIQHIVIVMQENHAYDNYFGSYCPHLGTYCSYAGNGTPPGTCLPIYPAYPKVGCVAPWRFPNASSMYRDIVHDRNSSITAFANGTNQGFIPAESAGNLTMGYWDWHALGDYWQMAEQYALGDNFFSSAMSYSLANHWYLLAGASPAVGTDEYVSPTPGYQPNWTHQSLYLNQSNATPAIDDLLINSSVSWNYYDFGLPATYNKSISGGQVWAYWNPLAAKAESYQSPLTPHFVPRNQFFADAKNGRLPNVSWVIPTIPNSEHPPYNVTTGEQWVVNVTQAVENSPEWNSTAVFVSWDEYGGFYDSVPPPVVDGVGLSFRVPLLVISPYVRQNYISHQFGDFESLLKLVEWRFGLTQLTARDQAAVLPLNAFDFQATPRSPMVYGAAQGATYPVPFQSLPAPGVPTNLTVRSGPGGLTIRWDPPVGGTAPTYYKLAFSPKGTPVPLVIRVDGAADGFVLNGLAANTTYYLTLQTVGAGNASAKVPFHARTLADTNAGPFAPGAVPSGSAPAPTMFLTRPLTVYTPLRTFPVGARAIPRA